MKRTKEMPRKVNVDGNSLKDAGKVSFWILMTIVSALLVVTTRPKYTFEAEGVFEKSVLVKSTHNFMLGLDIPLPYFLVISFCLAAFVGSVLSLLSVRVGDIQPINLEIVLLFLTTLAILVGAITIIASMVLSISTADYHKANAVLNQVSGDDTVASPTLMIRDTDNIDKLDSLLKEIKGDKEFVGEKPSDPFMESTFGGDDKSDTDVDDYAYKVVSRGGKYYLVSVKFGDESPSDVVRHGQITKAQTKSIAQVVKEYKNG